MKRDVVTIDKAGAEKNHSKKSPTALSDCGSTQVAQVLERCAFFSPNKNKRESSHDACANIELGSPN